MYSNGTSGTVARLGNKGESEYLEKSRKGVEERTEGGLNKLDQNREGPVGMCVENMHGS